MPVSFFSSIVIVCGGDVSHCLKKFLCIVGSNSAEQDKTSTYTIAVDSGAEVFYKAKIIPDVLIGDFDSIKKKHLVWCKKNNVKIINYPKDKDYTDCYLALEFLKKSIQSKRLIVSKNPSMSLFGAIGDRFDHSLSNIYSLTNDFYSKFSITFYTPSSELIFLHKNKTLKIYGKKGDFFSIVPLSKKISGLKIKNAKWDLRYETIYQDRMKTISNEFLMKPVYITLNKGLGIVICQTIGTG